MKNSLKSGFAALFALLLLFLMGCRTATSTPENTTPSPSPSSTPAPVPTHSPNLPENANTEVLKWLDEVLADGSFCLAGWLTAGSGPHSVTVYGHEDAIRTLFSSKNWVSCASVETEYSPAHWSGWLSKTNQLDMPLLMLNTGHDYLTVRVPDSNGYTELTFTAQGASSILMELADMSASPFLRLLFPEMENSRELTGEALAQSYFDAFRALYLDSGHVTDVACAEPEIVAQDEVTLLLRLSCLLTPADPNDPAWQHFLVNGNGQYIANVQLCICLDSDNVWRGDWVELY